jgi:hypothetical protein
MFDMSNHNVVIEKLLLIPTVKDYHDPYIRNIELHSTHAGVEAIRKTLEHSSKFTSSGKLTDNLVAANAPGISQLSNTPTHKVNIANGWKERRFRFMIKAVETIANGISRETILQGYTDYADSSFSGHIDDNTTLYVNNILSAMRHKQPNGMPDIVRIESFDNVIVDNTYDFRQNINNSHRVVRPTDVFENISNNETKERLFADSIINTTSVLNTETVLSSKKNNSPLTHFNRTMNGLIDAANNSDLSYGEDMMVMDAATNVKERNISDITIMRLFQRETGDIFGNTIKLGQFSNLFPYVAGNAQIFQVISSGELKNYMGINNLDIHDGEFLNNTDVHSRLAATIEKSLSGEMANNFLSKIRIVASNITGETVVGIMDDKSYIDGLDTTPFKNKMEAYITTVLMPEISNSNLNIISFDVSIDVYLDTVVSLSVNNEQAIPYVSPSFADSLYAPVVTTVDHNNNLTGSYETMLDLVRN